jgi:uncharacterized metal-binding protein YceD (DUF177 family)
MSDTAILSLSVSAQELPAAPVEISASAAARAALAAENDLISVDSLTASVELSRAPGGAIVAAGRVIADIVQTCVVSLVPVPAHIDESFTVRFIAGVRAGHEPDEELVVDPAAPDPPEVLTGPGIDVGALVEEHFVLAIDPYPRAPDAVLPGSAQPGDDATTGIDSPFAALAALVPPAKDRDRK